MRYLRGLTTTLGAFALVCAAVETALAASGYCKGTVVTTGSGGGLICVNVNCTSMCKIKTSVMFTATYKACYCDGVTEYPLCCSITWVNPHDPEEPDFAHTFGSCEVQEDPCPLPGTCTHVTNGSQHTAECE